MRVSLLLLRRLAALAAAVVVIVLLLGGALTFERWWPRAQEWVQAVIAQQRRYTSSGEHGDAHEPPGGPASAHQPTASLKLSPQALANIGLTVEYLRPVELRTFHRTITVPAIVVERPGRTRIEISTPMAGVITHVHAVQGEAVTPGAQLMELRITGEELVATQTELLRTVGELDVERREIARLEEVTRSGAVPQKTLLERQYARERLEVQLLSQREALRLHGLSERQINDVAEHRRLMRDLEIVAPEPDRHHHDEELRLTSGGGRAEGPGVVPAPVEAPEPAPEPDESPLILQEVLVHKGQSVAAGERLAVVADLSELYLEGRAFEQDADLLTHAAQQGWTVTARFERAGQAPRDVEGLELLYTAPQVDPESRTLRFYVRLPNEIVRQVPSPNGLSFVEWRYRPGQRLQLRIPVEAWERRIVLPVEAIAQEGVESFVFLQNGRYFDRVPVHVAYRDQSLAVIEPGQTLFPGDVVALRGAYQLQMTLRNSSGGAVDPHAGHSH